MVQQASARGCAARPSGSWRTPRPLRRRRLGAALERVLPSRRSFAARAAENEESEVMDEEPSYEDLEAQAMEFMAKQSAIETGEQGERVFSFLLSRPSSPSWPYARTH